MTNQWEDLKAELTHLRAVEETGTPTPWDWHTKLIQTTRDVEL